MGRVPSRGSDQFVLRMPEGMREKLRDIAEANGRSMNSEIVQRLQDSFDRDAQDAAYFASYQPPSQEEMEQQARAYREWMESTDSPSEPDFDPFEAEIFDELSKVVMKMARRRVEAQKHNPEPPMTPEDFYEYSMAQIEEMPEDERPGAIALLNQTMEKAATKFKFTWPPAKTEVPF